MIDWLTLRIPMTEELGRPILDRLNAAVGMLVSIRPDGSKAWEKACLDHESLRSDTPGLFWTVQGDSEGRRMLVIGGSPASIEHGINVFGSADIRHCATVLVRFAGKCLDAILPPVDLWQCRRIDITENYDMGSHDAVKHALRLLMATDSARRKASSDRHGGDTVYWSPKSDVMTGKAYHKGPQLRQLERKGKTQIEDMESFALMADRLLRFELKLGSRWFRAFEKAKSWLELTPLDLTVLHDQFFSRFVGSVEVADMSNFQEKLEKSAIDNGMTKGRGKAAYGLWLNIRSIGYDQARLATSKATWYRSIAVLRLAGLSDAELCAGNVHQIVRKQLVLSNPVTSWAQLRNAA